MKLEGHLSPPFLLPGTKTRAEESWQIIECVRSWTQYRIERSGKGVWLRDNAFKTEMVKWSDNGSSKKSVSWSRPPERCGFLHSVQYVLNNLFQVFLDVANFWPFLLYFMGIMKKDLSCWNWNKIDSTLENRNLRCQKITLPDHVFASYLIKTTIKTNKKQMQWGHMDTISSSQRNAKEAKY